MREVSIVVSMYQDTIWLLLFRHTGLVTCVSMDEGGLHCISGSQDTTAIVWELNCTQDVASLKIVQVTMSFCLDNEL